MLEPAAADVSDITWNELNAFFVLFSHPALACFFLICNCNDDMINQDSM
jgi:hypothetical protein